MDRFLQDLLVGGLALVLGMLALASALFNWEAAYELLIASRADGSGVCDSAGPPAQRLMAVCWHDALGQRGGQGMLARRRWQHARSRSVGGNRERE